MTELQYAAKSPNFVSTDNEAISQANVVAEFIKTLIHAHQFCIIELFSII